MEKKYDLKNLLKQRRVWAAALSVLALIAHFFDVTQLVMLCTALASGLGLNSYISPKK